MTRRGMAAVEGPGARRRPGIAFRRVWGAAAVAACLLLGGCIYLRLLELKNQLAHFDQYFDADLTDGIKLTCKQPVLLDEDMAFFKLAPETRQQIGVAQRWHFRWVKAYTAPGEHPEDYEVTADFIYVDHKLTRVILPERLFVFVPKKFFVLMLKAFGQANVDKAKRTANANVHEDFKPGDVPPRLSRAELRSVLGAPMEVWPTPLGEAWRYRYRAASPDQQSGFIDINFTMDPTSKTVRHIEGVVFNGRINLDFVAPPEQPAPAPPPASHADHP